MPFANPLLNNISWQDLSLNLGPISLQIGQFTADLLQFLILAFVIYVIAKKLLTMEKVKK